MDETRRFKPLEEGGAGTRDILRTVYASLLEKGYDPINQIVGYLLSEDPTYVTNYQNARSLIRRIDRDELMQELLKCYLGIE